MSIRTLELCDLDKENWALPFGAHARFIKTRGVLASPQLHSHSDNEYKRTKYRLHHITFNIVDCVEPPYTTLAMMQFSCIPLKQVLHFMCLALCNYKLMLFISPLLPLLHFILIMEIRKIVWGDERCAYKILYEFLEQSNKLFVYFHYSLHASSDN